MGLIKKTPLITCSPPPTRTNYILNTLQGLKCLVVVREIRAGDEEEFFSALRGENKGESDAIRGRF